MTSNMDPAHPHATSVAVYPAFFLLLTSVANQLCDDQIVKFLNLFVTIFAS